MFNNKTRMLHHLQQFQLTNVTSIKESWQTSTLETKLEFWQRYNAILRGVAKPL